MILDDKNAVFAECEKLGEIAVRAKLEAGNFGRFSAFHLEWLHQKAEDRLRQQFAEERERAERAIAAAEKSAHASQQAAMAARDSARWTMWAAIVALVSILAQHYIK